VLISFLEQEATLKSLSHSQMLEIETAFTLYLLRAISFREAYRRCDMILDEDQEYLKVTIKSKLSKMIEDADCNTIFKPAILRLINGDDVGFRLFNMPTTRTKRIIKQNNDILQESLKRVAYPIDQIGPKHIEKLENKYLEIVKPHAYYYVSRYARFLTMGDSGTTIDDLSRDLIILALRSMRQYYPWRKGLHLANTMRQTITNRGRGMITYSVAGVRQRLVMDEHRGVMVNRESSTGFEIASNWRGWADDPSRMHPLQSKIAFIAKGKGPEAKVAQFILSPEDQDQFCNWLEQVSPVTKGSEDLSAAVKKSGYPYASLLAKFLNLPKPDVKSTLIKLQSLVA